MAKTPSDKLHRLIRSLSSAEKRYFRIFIRGKTERESKYLRLFEAMAATSTFDEEKLKKKVYENHLPESKKYSELKAYLYDLVLKSLQTFDEQRSVESRLNQFLQGVEVLYRRGHYDDCLELLQKATRLARHYEGFTHLLEIIRWKKQLAYTRMDVDFLHKHLEQLLYEEEHTLEQLRNASTYRKVFFQVYALLKREPQHRGENRLDQLQSLVNQEFFSSPDLAISHKARVMYYRTLNVYYYAVLDYGAFYQTGQKLISLLESQPHFLQENLSEYIAGLSNLILSCGLLRKYDEVRSSLQKLRNLRPVTEDDRRKIHRQYFSNIFVLCIYTGDFAEGYAEMERCQHEAADFDPHDYETASFYFQYSVICFGNNDYNGALGHLNHWLNQPRSAVREDLQSLARILQLILHYEMNNIVLLESLLRSATRFMQKKHRLFELERRFMHDLVEVTKVNTVRERNHVFQKMKMDLEEQAKLPEVNALLQTFDLGAWLDSKMNRQTFAATVRAKFTLLEQERLSKEGEKS